MAGCVSARPPGADTRRPSPPPPLARVVPFLGSAPKLALSVIFGWLLATISTLSNRSTFANPAAARPSVGGASWGDDDHRDCVGGHLRSRSPRRGRPHCGGCEHTGRPHLCLRNANRNTDRNTDNADHAYQEGLGFGQRRDSRRPQCPALTLRSASSQVRCICSGSWRVSRRRGFRRCSLRRNGGRRPVRPGSSAAVRRPRARTVGYRGGDRRRTWPRRSAGAGRRGGGRTRRGGCLGVLRGLGAICHFFAARGP